MPCCVTSPVPLHAMHMACRQQWYTPRCNCHVQQHRARSQPSQRSAAARTDRLDPAQHAVNSIRLLEGVELAAISVAAIHQAVVLVSCAVDNANRSKFASNQESLQLTQRNAPADLVLEEMQQNPAQQHHISVDAQQSSWQHAAVGHSHQLQSIALLVALMCGAGLRYLQRSRLPSSAHVSADAAARLLALEATVQQHNAQLTTAARQLDKLQTRTRVATRDVKIPLKQTQGSTAQAAAAIAKLAEQQQQLQQQLDGHQQLMEALQGLAAKQFQVTAEALQQFQESQTQLSSRNGTVLAEVQQQQQALQQSLEQQLQQQQKRVAILESQCSHIALQQQQQQGIAAVNGSSSSWSSRDVADKDVHLHTHPDPWAASRAAGAAAGAITAGRPVSVKGASNGTGS